MNRSFCFVTAVTSALLAPLAWAGTDFTALPEPGTFELLALGGVVAAIVAIRNWRKK